MAVLGSAYAEVTGDEAGSTSGAPLWARSVRVVRGDEPVFGAPDGRYRRGTLRRDARLFFFGTRRGDGCPGAWTQIGPYAWVCDEGIEFVTEPAFVDSSLPGAHSLTGLPFNYFHVGANGSFGYRDFETMDGAEPSIQLDPGFTVASVEERGPAENSAIRTLTGYWVPRADLAPIRPPTLSGKELQSGDLSFAWVVLEHAMVYRLPTLSARTKTTYSKFQMVPVYEVIEQAHGKRFSRVGDHQYLVSSDLRMPKRAEPPPQINVEASERWIDIDLASQTLVAYEGRQPVFATLVSTGRESAAHGTPKGTFRIWIKLFTSHMDNLEEEAPTRYYRMENVPYVQYFSKGVGLHAAYWHNSFGHEHSHGCVNLAPLDAARLFAWTSPHLPANWTAVFPSPVESGTVIRVH